MNHFSEKKALQKGLRSPFPGEVAFCCAESPAPNAEGTVEDAAKGTAKGTAKGAAGSGAVGAEHPPVLPGERALLSQRASGKRVLEFALGRACARTALGRLGVADAAHLPILRGPGRQPLWPEAVVGSISHAQGLAVAAVAWQQALRALGMDLERIRPLNEATQRRVLLPEELERLQALPPADQAGNAMLVFSAKESLFKALNPRAGGFQGFQAAEITLLAAPSAAELGRFQWRLRQDWGQAWPVGFTGEGRYCVSGGWLLSGVWIPASPQPPHTALTE